MATQASYCLAGAENTKIALSHDELRILFTQVEAEFCQSEIYNRALDGLQKRLGTASKGVNLMIKAIGREAIRLALRKVVMKYQVSTDSPLIQTQGTQAAPTSDSSPSDSTSSSSPPCHLTSVSSTEHQPTTQHQATPSKLPKLGSSRDLPKPGKEKVTTSSISTSHVNASVSSSERDAKGVAQTVSTPVKPKKSKAPETATLPSPTDSVRASVSTQQQSLRQKVPSIPTSSSFPQRSKSMSPSVLEEARKKAFEQVGQTLQQARLARSWSPQEIYQKTHVPLHQIQALEAGQIEQLPEDIYVRGFIRRIADVLALDSSALISALPSEPAEPVRVPTWSLPKLTPEARRNYLRPAHLYVGYAALMAGAAGGLVWMIQQEGDRLDAMLDVPELFQDILPNAVFEQNSNGFTRRQTEGVRSGAIANPETIPVESSTGIDAAFP